MKSPKFLLLLFWSSLFFIDGCGSQRTIAHMGFGNFDITTEFTRNDIVVLERVNGTSKTDSILFGIIQIVDGNELRLFCSAATELQAYYNALSATPEPDVVFYKSMYKECSGFPLFFMD